MTFRTRFAPSPTGYLHIGTTRTVLHTVLLTRANQGKWFLRLEDTDRNRLMPDAFQSLLSGLYKLNLIPDEGVVLESEGLKDEFYGVYQKGGFGSYIQSERLAIYHQHAQELIDRRLAYWSYLSSEERGQIQSIKQNTRCPIDWFNLSRAQVTESELYADVSKGLEDVRKPVLRFILQRPSILECQDELLGQTKFDLALEEDPVFLKSDGYPTYALAHLIDDKLMQTTHVIRSQEWYPSLPLHTQMYIDYWGAGSVLKYMHIPYILGPAGNKKMSKRDGNVNMDDYFSKGYLPEAILNYLAFLGWNPGTDKELYLDRSHFAN